MRHSKCRVPKRNLGFESLTLRHIAGAKFALLRHFYAQISSVCAFGDFPFTFKTPALRQSKPCLHRLRRGDLGLVIQVGVDVRRGGKVAVAQPLLNMLEGNAVSQQQVGAAVTQIVKTHPALPLESHTFCSVSMMTSLVAGCSVRKSVICSSSPPPISPEVTAKYRLSGALSVRL